MSPMVRARTADELLQSIEATYRFLRAGLGVVALALPLVLLFGGLARGVPLQGSMSAYYYTVMRDVFVGVLFAAGAGLLFYRGFSRAEDWALNLAGVLAMLVALIPAPPDGRFTLHGTLAVSFFIALAYVAIFRAKDTLRLFANPADARPYRRLYQLLGALMVVLPLAAAALAAVWRYPEGTERPIVFAVEMAAIYAFGIFWIVKSREILGIQRQQGTDAAPHAARQLAI